MSKRRNRKKKAIDTQSTMPKGILNDSAEVLSVKKAFDAYSNPAANLGIGGNNLAQTASYVMERMTWDYYTLNTLFRNNWIAKAIIEKPANEMLKNGFEIQSELDPDKIAEIERVWRKTKTKDKFLDCLKWARLYGGCVLIPMIEGQSDLSTPLDYDTIMPDSYKGCFLVDRWSGISPSSELEEDIADPEFGQPKYYTISTEETDGSVKIHHSRLIKMIGRELPRWEKISEMFWGASELEHVYTELKKRDDTSANISFLIFLANIRVYKMQNLGQALTLGDQQSMQRVYETMQQMNRLMCNTGTFAMDKDDDFTMQSYTFTGINDIYESFMLDISGAAEIPIDKLFGRSPNGFNSGEATLRSYYDTIQEKQETYVRAPLEKLIKIITMSTLGEIPDDLEIIFNPIRQASDDERAELASKTATTIFEGYAAGIYGKGTVLRELKQLSSIVGMWSNITDNMIQEADDEDEKAQKEEQENKANLEQGLNEVLNNGNIQEKEAEENSSQSN